MAAVKSHVAVAASEGMKAGFNAYTRKLKASGLPEVRAKASEFRGRAGFKLYCATFGADVDAAKGALTRTPRTHTRSSGRTTTPVLSEREQLLARLAELDAAEQAPVVATPKPRKAVKENLWRPWAIRKFSIPTTVGATWTYNRKKSRGTSVHKVTRVTAEGVYTIKVS